MSKRAYSTAADERSTEARATTNPGTDPESAAVSGAHAREAGRSVGQWFSRARGVGEAHPRLLLGTWTALLLFVVTGVGLLGWQHHLHNQAEEARQQATEAATAAVPDVLSYNYRTIDDDLARAKTHLTGDFARQFGQLTSQIVAPQAVQGQITTRAEIAATSVVEAVPNRVVELLFVNQTTQGLNLPQPRVDGSRLVLTMEKVNNQWLIQNLEPI